MSYLYKNHFRWKMENYCHIWAKAGSFTFQPWYSSISFGLGMSYFPFYIILLREAILQAYHYSIIIFEVNVQMSSTCKFSSSNFYCSDSPYYTMESFPLYSLCKKKVPLRRIFLENKLPHECFLNITILIYLSQRSVVIRHIYSHNLHCFLPLLMFILWVIPFDFLKKRDAPYAYK